MPSILCFLKSVGLFVGSVGLLYGIFYYCRDTLKEFIHKTMQSTITSLYDYSAGKYTVTNLGKELSELRIKSNLNVSQLKTLQEDYLTLFKLQKEELLQLVNEINNRPKPKKNKEDLS